MSGRPDQPLLSIVVPAYNEVQRIARTVADIQSFLDGRGYTYEVIVSADGTDGTREAVAAIAATDPRVSVIGSPERRGKGRGVREGILRARGQFVGNVDADYKTPIDQVERMLPYLREGYPVVIGSRRAEGTKIEKHQPLYRRVGSKGFAFVMRAMVGLYGINDTQCGFKFFSRSAAQRLFTKQKIDGYMFDVEILRLARLEGYRIKEVGVRWADDGDTRYDPISGTIRNAKELLRIRFMRYDEDRARQVDAPAASPPALAGAGNARR
ncbi:MAG: arnC 2 [Phycisphaerales bacterium]|nr:arnC 2 [Phycisphaerales bacterium]